MFLVFGRTGYICDDGFGMQNAEVACKELGYPQGALEVRGNSFYAKDMKENSSVYLMDDVKCIGNETSLKDCDFNGWGITNCLDQEIVGVVCKTPQEKCPQDSWKCFTQNECVPLAFMCDGVDDCFDKSDETSQICDVCYISISIYSISFDLIFLLGFLFLFCFCFYLFLFVTFCLYSFIFVYIRLFCLFFFFFLGSDQAQISKRLLSF